MENCNNDDGDSSPADVPGWEEKGHWFGRKRTDIMDAYEERIVAEKRAIYNSQSLAWTMKRQGIVATIDMQEISPLEEHRGVAFADRGNSSGSYYRAKDDLVKGKSLPSNCKKGKKFRKSIPNVKLASGDDLVRDFKTHLKCENNSRSRVLSNCTTGTCMAHVQLEKEDEEGNLPAATQPNLASQAPKLMSPAGENSTQLMFGDNSDNVMSQVDSQEKKASQLLTEMQPSQFYGGLTYCPHDVTDWDTILEPGTCRSEQASEIQHRLVSLTNPSEDVSKALPDRSLTDMDDNSSGGEETLFSSLKDIDKDVARVVQDILRNQSEKLLNETKHEEMESWYEDDLQADSPHLQSSTVTHTRHPINADESLDYVFTFDSEKELTWDNELKRDQGTDSWEQFDFTKTQQESSIRDIKYDDIKPMPGKSQVEFEKQLNDDNTGGTCMKEITSKPSWHHKPYSLPENVWNMNMDVSPCKRKQRNKQMKKYLIPLWQAQPIVRHLKHSALMTGDYKRQELSHVLEKPSSWWRDDNDDDYLIMFTEDDIQEFKIRRIGEEYYLYKDASTQCEVEKNLKSPSPSTSPTKDKEAHESVGSADQGYCSMAMNRLTTALSKQHILGENSFWQKLFSKKELETKLNLPDDVIILDPNLGVVVSESSTAQRPYPWKSEKDFGLTMQSILSKRSQDEDRREESSAFKYKSFRNGSNDFLLFRYEDTTDNSTKQVLLNICDFVKEDNEAADADGNNSNQSNRNGPYEEYSGHRLKNKLTDRTKQAYSRYPEKYRGAKYEEETRRFRDRPSYSSQYQNRKGGMTQNEYEFVSDGSLNRRKGRTHEDRSYHGNRSGVVASERVFTRHSSKYDGPYDLPRSDKSKQAWLLLKAAHALQEKDHRSNWNEPPRSSKSKDAWKVFKALANVSSAKQPTRQVRSSTTDVRPQSERSRLAWKLMKTAKSIQEEKVPTQPQSSSSRQAWQLFKAANSAAAIRKKSKEEAVASAIVKKLYKDANINMNRPVSKSGLVLPVSESPSLEDAASAGVSRGIMKRSRSRTSSTSPHRSRSESNSPSRSKKKLLLMKSRSRSKSPKSKLLVKRKQKNSKHGKHSSKYSDCSDEKNMCARLPRVQLLTNTDKPVKTSFLRQVYRQHGRPCVTDRFILRSMKSQPPSGFFGCIKNRLLSLVGLRCNMCGKDEYRCVCSSSCQRSCHSEVRCKTSKSSRMRWKCAQMENIICLGLVIIGFIIFIRILGFIYFRPTYPRWSLDSMFINMYCMIFGHF